MDSNQNYPPKLFLLPPRRLDSKPEDKEEGHEPKNSKIGQNPHKISVHHLTALGKTSRIRR
jgi:hypothetical protein